MSRRDTPQRKPVKPLIAEPHAPAPPLPVDVFPAPLARFVTVVAEALPCPPDFVAVPRLALLGWAIGTRRILRVKPGWLEGPRLYAAVVAETGTQKSPALQLAAQPFGARQRHLRQHRLDTQGCADAMAPRPGQPSAPEARQTPWIASPLRGEVSAPPHLFTTDATREALLVLLAQNPWEITLIPDELSASVRSLNRYRGGKGADRQRF